MKLLKLIPVAKPFKNLITSQALGFSLRIVRYEFYGPSAAFFCNAMMGPVAMNVDTISGKKLSSVISLRSIWDEKDLLLLKTFIKCLRVADKI